MNTQKNNMRFWITTDTHLGHNRMIEFGRPENFEEKILKSFSPLERNDVLIHLGDVCIGHDEENHKRLLDAIPCKKWLIKGNHDHKSTSWYLDHGWDFVANTFSLAYGGKRIIFSHVPQDTDKLGMDLNIHGHLHDNNHRTEDYPFMSDKNILLALEYTDYQPRLLETLLNENFKKTRTGN